MIVCVGSTGKIVGSIGAIPPICGDKPPICLGKGVCNGSITGSPGSLKRSRFLNLLNIDISYEGCAWPLKVSMTLYITSMPRSLSSSKLGTKLMIPPGSVFIS